MRKRSESIPLKDHALYRQLYDSAPIGIGMADLSGRVLNVNPAMEKITGYSRNELLGTNLEKVYAVPGDRRKMLALVRKKGSARNFETRHKRKDGTIIWVRINVDPLDAPGRKIFLSTVMDITLLKQAESRLRKDAERNAILISFYDKAAHMGDREFHEFALDEAVRLTDSKIGFFHSLSDDQTTGILTAWNSEALERCKAPYDPHYPLARAGNWADCVRQKRPVIYNDYSSSPNQKGLPSGHSPIKRFLSVPVIEDGKVRIIFGVGNKAADYDEDDTLRLQILAAELHKIFVHRRAEKALRESEERFRLVFDHSLDAIFLTEPDGRVLSANQAACRMFGRSEKEIIRVGRKGIVDPSDSRLAAALRRRRQTGNYRSELTLVRKDGTKFPADVSSAVFTDRSGQVRTSMIVHDIGERKRGEEQLRQFSQQIIAVREEEKKRLAAALHHDVGSLSVGLSARLNAAEDDIRAGRNGAALASLEDSRRMFEDAVSRFKNLAVELRPPALDILGLSAALRQHFAQQSRAGAVRIQFTVATKGKKIPETVATALFRVAQESLTNAIKHAEATHVWVRLAVVREGIRFSLRDDGKGFDLVRVATGGGRHFGLQAMEEMVSSQGGRFTVRSRPGRGTEVAAIFAKGVVAP